MEDLAANGSMSQLAQDFFVVENGWGTFPKAHLGSVNPIVVSVLRAKPVTQTRCHAANKACGRWRCHGVAFTFQQHLILYVFNVKFSMGLTLNGTPVTHSTAHINHTMHVPRTNNHVMYQTMYGAAHIDQTTHVQRRNNHSMYPAIYGTAHIAPHEVVLFGKSGHEGR